MEAAGIYHSIPAVYSIFMCFLCLCSKYESKFVFLSKITKVIVPHFCIVFMKENAELFAYTSYKLCKYFNVNQIHINKYNQTVIYVIKINELFFKLCKYFFSTK